MSRVHGGVVLALLTKPEQPLKKAAEQLSIKALTAHTHALALVFTFITLWAGVSSLAGTGGGGPRK